MHLSPLASATPKDSPSIVTGLFRSFDNLTDRLVESLHVGQ